MQLLCGVLSQCVQPTCDMDGERRVVLVRIVAKQEQDGMWPFR